MFVIQMRMRWTNFSKVKQTEIMLHTSLILILQDLMLFLHFMLNLDLELNLQKK
jgi:hypothetical protein